MMNDHILAKMISTVSSYAKESSVGNYTFDTVISYLESEGYEKGNPVMAMYNLMTD